MPGSDWVCPSSARNFTDASQARLVRDVFLTQVRDAPCTLSFTPRSVPLHPGPHSRPRLQKDSACSDETGQVSCGQASGGTDVSRGGQADTLAGGLHSPRPYPDLRTRSGRKSEEQLRRWAKLSKEGPSP